MAVSEFISSARSFEPDERQRQAIEHLHGPMLVVAGAGTGKTTVLIRRVARLIREGYARPDEVLAVTYTRNAAEEMAGRVRLELNRGLKGADLAGLQVRTFHDYCNQLLARAGRQFGVLDDKDLWIFLRRRIRELHLNHFVRAADVGKFLNDLLDFMRRCQDELVGPDKYAAYVRQLELGELPLPRVAKKKDVASLTDDEVLSRCQEIAQVFATVERMLREDNLGTFGHMITGAYELLQDSRQLEAARAHSRFILVDEFQDANYAQVKILRMLAGEPRNVFAVGDPDQAIYQFRGASSAAFGLFQRHFPGTRLVRLEKNRRSTTAILQSAFAIIEKNPEALASDGLTLSSKRKALISARDEDRLREGQLPVVRPTEAVISVGKEVESLDVVAAIRQRRREFRCKWEQIAVLYRQHSHRDKVAEELAAHGIPFSIENMDVMDTPEVRDLLACLGAIVSERDGASLFRVAALPQFAIDPDRLRAGMKSLPRNAEQDAGLARVLGQIEGGPAVLNTLQRVRDQIAHHNAKSRAAAAIIVREFGFDPASRPLQAVLDFIAVWEEKAITRTKELAELLDYLDYFREACGAIPMSSPGEDAVALMTAHTAKGLEWDHVFILRANSSSFPCSYKAPLFEFPVELREDDSMSSVDAQILHEQEERRLFYVAMTRARDSLTMYAQQGRGRKDPTPPGFLRELLANSGIGQWFRRREAQAFAGELFAAAAAVPLASRASQWLEMPPISNLNDRLSATALEIYEACPLRFKLEREWRIPRDVPAALQYGAAMHRVLKTYYDAIRLKRPMADEQLIQLFLDDLAAAGLQDRYQQELYEKQGVEQLRAFLEQCRKHPVPEVLHSEEGFEMSLGGANVVGRIDRMDQMPGGQVAVTDYKTGKPRSQEDADKSLQLSIYTLGARAKWGYQVDALILYNLEENAPVVTRRSQAQLDEARLKVEDVARQIAAGDFRPKTGFHCNFCPYRNLCPATEKRLFVMRNEKMAGAKSNRKGSA
jgi:DNA helicase-2/ATP-dependent DNA helicase PcrA